MSGRSIWDGIAEGLDGDQTTTGAIAISSLPCCSNLGRGVLRDGDITTQCPKCGKGGVILGNIATVILEGKCAAGNGAVVICGCKMGSNRLICLPGALSASRVAVDTVVVTPRQKRPSQSQPQYRQPMDGQRMSERWQSSTVKSNCHEITLTVGLFFDGTSNNGINIETMLQTCSASHFNLSDIEAEEILSRCNHEKMGVSGIGATSYNGYFTNIYWLSKLYRQAISADLSMMQTALYIEGIGTEAGKPDSLMGQAFGVLNTGVIAKVNDAISLLPGAIIDALGEIERGLKKAPFMIRALKFDLFGFSRGAAAARHFANLIQSQDRSIIQAIRQGIGNVHYRGAPAGKTRFIGILDTVAAIATPLNGLNPNSADTGAVKLVLRPNVAEKVFHITAQHECRFNFALNSVRPVWPELALPGVHQDIGGGYLPVVTENLFLTRPRTVTVPLSQPNETTSAYQRTLAHWQHLKGLGNVALFLNTNCIKMETWFDDRLPPDQYDQFQKRSYAAVSMRHRVVKNDWSNVVLQVMLDAAGEAGVLFNDIKTLGLAIPAELALLCNKAIAQGKAQRAGQQTAGFTREDIALLANHYIHCSANWNAIKFNAKGMIYGGAYASKLISFVNRPDSYWLRTVYDMSGKPLNEDEKGSAIGIAGSLNGLSGMPETV